MAHWRRPRSMTAPFRKKTVRKKPVGLGGTVLVALAGLVSGAWLWSARRQPGIDRETAVRLNTDGRKEGVE